MGWPFKKSNPNSNSDQSDSFEYVTFPTIYYARYLYSWPFTVVSVITKENSEYLLTLYTHKDTYNQQTFNRKNEYRFNEYDKAVEAARYFNSNPKKFAEEFEYINEVKFDYIYPTNFGLIYYPAITNTIENGISSEHIYSVGLDLYRYLNGEEFGLNKSDQEIYKILGMYLYNVPIRFAYFQQYKWILKKIEEIYLNWEDRESFKGLDDKSNIAFALGVGYAVLETQPHSRWDKRYNADARYENYQADFVVRVLNAHFDENLRLMPSFKTFQYLMRRGRRIYRSMVASGNSDANAFKIGYLFSFDYSSLSITRTRTLEDGSRESFEVDQLSSQWLAAELIYGQENGLVINRDGRSIEIPNIKKRQNGGTLEVKGLGEETLKLFNFNNADVTVAIYNHCKAVGLEFPWTAKSISIALKGFNSEMRKEVRIILKDKIDQIYHLEPELILNLLEDADTSFINLLISSFEEIEMTRNMGNGLGKWAQKHYLDDFSKKDLALSMAILKHAYNYLPYYGYQYANPAGFSNYNFRLASFVLPYKLAIATKLEPISDWQIIFKNLGSYNLATYLMAGQKTWNDFTDLSEDFEKIGDFRDINLSLSASSQLPWGDLAGLIPTGSNDDIARIERRLLNHSNAWVRYIGFNLLAKSSMNWSKLFPQISSKPYFVEYLEYLLELSEKKISTEFIESFGGEESDYLWRKNKDYLNSLFSKNVRFKNSFWSKLQELSSRSKSRFSAIPGFVEGLIAEMNSKRIKTLNQGQADFLADYLDTVPTKNIAIELLEMLISSPYPRLHHLAVDAIDTRGVMDEYWLAIAETNLPYCLATSKSYLLKSQKKSNLEDLLLMALDSNQRNVRGMALEVIHAFSKHFDISVLIDSLSEHYETDIWKVVVNNFDAITSEELKQEFISKVFLSKRKARSIKEQVKTDLANDATNWDLESLIRMARASNLNDRDFAFQMIAKHYPSSSQVAISYTTEGDSNVH